MIACAGGFSSIAAIQAATTTIPIVFAVAEDPVRLGLVASLARPGGNLTGINFLNDELVAKRLQILRELVPGAARVAVLVNPSGTTGEATTKDLDAAARTIGLQVRILNASNSGEIDTAFASLANDRPDALFVAADPTFNNRRKQVVLQAMRHRLPAAYASRRVAPFLNDNIGKIERGTGRAKRRWNPSLARGAPRRIWPIGNGRMPTTGRSSRSKWALWRSTGELQTISATA